MMPADSLISCSVEVDGQDRFLIISEDFHIENPAHAGTIHLRGLAEHSQLTLVPWERDIRDVLFRPNFESFKLLISFYLSVLRRIRTAKVLWIRDTFAFLLFGTTGKLLGKKLIFDAPSFAIEHTKTLNPGTGESQLSVAFAQIIERLACKLSDRVRVLSQRAKVYMVENLHVKPDKVVVIPVGTDIPPETWTYEHCDKRVVSYIGSDAGWQGVDRLEAVAEMLAEADISVRIIGFSRNPTSPNIEYVGKVPYEDIAPYYLSSQVIVIPRPSNIITETILPMKLITAMSYGVPIVASDVGGINEVVKHGGEAYLVSPVDNLNLAQGLIDVVNNAELCRELGKNARQLAESVYTWPKVRAQVDHLLDGLSQ